MDQPVPLLHGACAGRVEPLALRARLKLRVEGENGRVLADRGWLEQILLAMLGVEGAHRLPQAGGIVTLRADATSA